MNEPARNTRQNTTQDAAQIAAGGPAADEPAGPGRLVKTTRVPGEVARVFELFTEHIGAWWPLATHSVGREDAVSVAIEGHVGGRIVEQIGDGRTEVWGTVTRWNPPHRIAFTWHPGRSATEMTTVVVRFTETDGATEVELTHTGWAARSDSVAARHSYDAGWEVVLGRFAEHLDAAG